MSDEDRAIAAEHGGSFAETARDGADYRLRFVAHPSRGLRLATTTSSRIRRSGSCSTTSGASARRRPSAPRLHAAWQRRLRRRSTRRSPRRRSRSSRREPEAAVLFHDYHLYLAPALVREARPDVLTVALRPHPVARAGLLARAASASCGVAIHEGLLANDVVGFHTERWRRAFLASCEVLLGARWIGVAGRSSTRTAARVSSRSRSASMSAEFERARRRARSARARGGRSSRGRPEQLVAPRRPHRPVQEHRARVPGLCAPARAPSGAARGKVGLARAARAVARGHRGVRRLRARPSRRRPRR